MKSPVVIDASSDTATQPTIAMWRAMRSTPLGVSDTEGDDSVTQLERLAAEIVGKEAALFVVTGRLANLLAMLSHSKRGEQVLLDQDSHVLRSEDWGMVSICGLLPTIVPGSNGVLDSRALERAITTKHYDHLPKTSLVCLENSFDASGGTVIRPDETETICTTAHRYRAAVHLDGARLFNAAAALRVDAKALTRPVDSVAFSICKGLSAPMGSLLCGTEEFIDTARYHRRVLGASSVHKLGIAAAAGVVALSSMIGRLDQDNRVARLMGDELASMPGLIVTPQPVVTNIVMVDVTRWDPSGLRFHRELRARGVETRLRRDGVIRLVTHRHIGDRESRRIIRAFREITREMFRR